MFICFKKGLCRPGCPVTYSRPAQGWPCTQRPTCACIPCDGIEGGHCQPSLQFSFCLRVETESLADWPLLQSIFSPPPPGYLLCGSATSEELS